MAKKKDTYTAQYTHYAHPEEVLDPVTGEVRMKLTEETITRTVEVMPDYVDIKMPKKFRFNNGNFITIFQKAMANIALFANLSKEEYKLLIYLIGTCGIGNSICTDLDKLADELSMKKPNVSRGLKGLVQRNIVVRKDGYRYGKTPLPFELHLDFDQINYDLAYNGKIKHYREDKDKHPLLMQSDGETPLLEMPSKTESSKKIKTSSDQYPSMDEVFFDDKHKDYDCRALTEKEMAKLMELAKDGQFHEELQNILYRMESKSKE